MDRHLRHFVLWAPRRQLRLAAQRLMAVVRPADYRYVAQAVAATFEQGIEKLGNVLVERRRHDRAFSRYREEMAILAFEARLKREVRPGLDARDHVELRRRDLGLDGNGQLIHVFDACTGRYQDRPLKDIPLATRLIIGGSRHEEFEAALEEMAALVDDAAPWLRWRRFSEAKAPDLRYGVLREWVEANGWRRKKHQEQLAHFIERHKEARLSVEPAESYANLDASMIGLARDLAAKVKPGDSDLAFYVFRVLQRIGAYMVGQRVQWDSRWFRGAKTNPRAIPGTSGRQPDLNRVLQEHLFELEKGHSGATGVCAVYKIRVPIMRGVVDENLAAQELGIELDAKKRPRRRWKAVESV